MIHLGMVAGAPFPGILDWTWGEIDEYLLCRNEAKLHDLRDEAAMLFRMAFLQNGLMNAKKGKRFDITQEFPFLWSDEERKEIAAERQEMAMYDAMMQMNAGLASHKATEQEADGVADNEEGGASDEWKRKLSG